MAIKEILLLGNEKLYEVCSEVSQSELEHAKQVVTDLHDTMQQFKKDHGFGRAIAAPQINQLYRIIYMNINGEPTAFINPTLEPIGEETFELWDDCMSFPGLEVKLNRYSKVKVSYKDLEWNNCVVNYEGDLSELIQHEYDHLDGILAVERANDHQSFRLTGKNSLASS